MAASCCQLLRCVCNLRHAEAITSCASVLQRMRREFEYWYPFDLRVSGKDLIQVRGWLCM